MSGWYCATTVLSLMYHKKSKNVKHIYNYIYMFLHLLKFNFGPTHPRRTNFRRRCYTPPWLLPQNSWRSSWSLYLRRQARVKQPRNARQNAGNSFSVRKTIEHATCPFLGASPHEVLRIKCLSTSFSYYNLNIPFWTPQDYHQIKAVSDIVTSLLGKNML